MGGWKVVVPDYFGGSWEKDDHVLGYIVKTKFNATPFLSKEGTISCDDAIEAFQCIYQRKIDDEREHYKVNMYRGESESDPDDIPLLKLRSHHYRCLRALKAFCEKTEEVSKGDAECSFWMLYTDWSDEIEDYEPEGGCASDIDADKLPIKDLLPCMYTYFRILGGYWCEQDDGLGTPKIEEVDGQKGYMGINDFFESQSQEETEESQSQEEQHQQKEDNEEGMMDNANSLTSFEKYIERMKPEEFQKNFEKSLNISEKVNITEAKEASERMMRFMTQDADVVKFMTDMKFDYKDLHKVNSYVHNS